MSFLTKLLASIGSRLAEKLIGWVYNLVMGWKKVKDKIKRNKEVVDKVKNSGGETPEERRKSVDEAIDSIIDNRRDN